MRERQDSHLIKTPTRAGIARCLNTRHEWPANPSHSYRLLRFQLNRRGLENNSHGAVQSFRTRPPCLAFLAHRRGSYREDDNVRLGHFENRLRDCASQTSRTTCDEPYFTHCKPLSEIIPISVRLSNVCLFIHSRVAYVRAMAHSE